MLEELKLPGAQEDGVTTGSPIQLQRDTLAKVRLPSAYLLRRPHSPYRTPFPLDSLLYGFLLPEVSQLPQTLRFAEGWRVLVISVEEVPST